MTKSPKVIFNSLFTLSFNNPDNKFSNRKKSTKRIVDMYDYYANEEKRVMSMYDYYTGKINKEENVNLILENGEYATAEEIVRRKKQAVKYLENSNLWQGVLSFNNDYITENIDVHYLETKLATEILPQFFKHCGFKDNDKMFYQLALHGDTDNLHFHFSFMEKSPNYNYTKGKVAYRRKGELSEEEIDFLKDLVVHTIEREKIYTPLLIKTNEEIDNLKKYFNPKERNFLLKDKKDLLYEEKILKLGQMLYDYRKGKNGKVKYGSINDKEIIDLTKDIKRYLFSKNNNFDLDYKNFKSSLEDINNYFLRIHKENNIQNINIDTSLTDSKNKYIDNYICNAIVNHSVYYYKTQKSKNRLIKDHDLIQSIILKHYLKNKKQTRKNIIENYLSNPSPSLKYKNKRKVEQAIRNINDEMEEAQKEFSKLFQKDNEKEM